SRARHLRPWNPRETADSRLATKALLLLPSQNENGQSLRCARRAGSLATRTAPRVAWPTIRACSGVPMASSIESGLRPKRIASTGGAVKSATIPFRHRDLDRRTCVPSAVIEFIARDENRQGRMRTLRPSRNHSDLAARVREALEGPVEQYGYVEFRL